MPALQQFKRETKGVRNGATPSRLLAVPPNFFAITMGLVGYAVLMVLVQVRLAPLYWKTPFAPSFWAFTFSYAAVASGRMMAFSSQWSWMGRREPLSCQCSMHHLFAR